jgi:hypothetical protein
MSVHITVAHLRESLRELPDNTPLCPDCKAELAECEGDDGKELYCPNEMCLNETRY